jgi:predicted nucleic acid-binding protein
MAISLADQPVIVPDTSVVIKWFRQGEILAAPALAIRDAYLTGQTTISAPSLMAYELANVLRYKSDLTPEQVEEAVYSLFEMEFEWVSPSATLMSRTIHMARSYETTVYDAAFVALAEELSGICITADQKLASRLEHLPFVTFLGEVDL